MSKAEWWYISYVLICFHYRNIRLSFNRIQNPQKDSYMPCKALAHTHKFFQVRSSCASNLIFEFAHNISSTTTTTAHTNDTATPNNNTPQSPPQALGYITINNMTTIQCWLMRDNSIFMGERQNSVLERWKFYWDQG